MSYAELKKRELPPKPKVTRTAALAALEPRQPSSVFFNTTPDEKMRWTDPTLNFRTDLRTLESDTQSTGETASDELETYMSTKVDLRYFDTRDNALRVKAALQQSGIESFLDPYRSDNRDPFYRTMLQVAEDDYEGAVQTLSLLTPEKLRDFDPQIEEPDVYASPDCPRCSASDPLLESVEPVNQWRCDSCGFEWTDAPESA